MPVECGIRGVAARGLSCSGNNSIPTDRRMAGWNANLIQKNAQVTRYQLREVRV